MKDTIIELFQQYPNAAIIISLVISILIAVSGILPSVFITAANILFFGFWKGTLISFIGEALGAAIAFWLYRKGFKQVSNNKLDKFPKAKKLVMLEGRPAFMMIMGLRLLPFVPSGLVTFAAAIGRVTFLIFIIASSIGKIPALLIEAYSVYQVTEFGWQGKLILAIIAIAIIWFVLRSRNKQ